MEKISTKGEKRPCNEQGLSDTMVQKKEEDQKSSNSATVPTDIKEPVNAKTKLEKTTNQLQSSQVLDQPEVIPLHQVILNSTTAKDANQPPHLVSESVAQLPVCTVCALKKEECEDSDPANISIGNSVHQTIQSTIPINENTSTPTHQEKASLNDQSVESPIVEQHSPKIASEHIPKSPQTPLPTTAGDLSTQTCTEQPLQTLENTIETSSSDNGAPGPSSVPPPQPQLNNADFHLKPANRYNLPSTPNYQPRKVIIEGDFGNIDVCTAFTQPLFSETVELVFKDFDSVFPITQFPPKVVRVDFIGGKYKGNIRGYPQTLRVLSLPPEWNRSTWTLPELLTHLRFGACFNKKIEYLPPRLTNLEFGNSFNKVLAHLPRGLRYLRLGANYNQPIEQLPPSLLCLWFGQKFQKVIPLSQIPNLVLLMIEPSYQLPLALPERKILKNIGKFLEEICPPGFLW
eukprot:TRINITY_DN2626_c0_g1_i3.p1 TRINITY_DN2626_c0_g1~~TRINITY_DN2626_c0_g1_i3.p1  ORF type:complete len:459 (-),score=102.23 TRINITY_DN2626_c0_g1_i3:428-1804(-)